MKTIEEKINQADPEQVRDYYEGKKDVDEDAETPIPELSLEAKHILRAHLHGYSDEKFDQEVNKFPLNECLIAMSDHAQQTKDKYVGKEVDKAKQQWISAEIKPYKTLEDKNGEIYVICMELDTDGSILQVNKAFYEPETNFYWVPFMG